MRIKNSSFLPFVSAALLSLSSDGGIFSSRSTDCNYNTKILTPSDWQTDFLHQISLFLPELTFMLESNVCTTMDNVSVILQKLSKKLDTRQDLIKNSRLLNRLHQLSKMDCECFGGGGDTTMDELATGVSEFLLCNVQFILKNCKVSSGVTSM